MRAGKRQGSASSGLLTVGWRRAVLAKDKVVRHINLAKNTGALAAGQWTIMTVYVPPPRLQGRFQLKEEIQDYRSSPYE